MNNVKCDNFSGVLYYSLHYITICEGFDKNKEKMYSLGIYIHENYSYVFELSGYYYRSLLELRKDLSIINEILGNFYFTKNIEKRLKST